MLPAFQDGGRVEKTGIALIHEGEYILPASGSEAIISPAVGAPDSEMVINYYFPIEIEIVGELGAEQLKDITEAVWNALETELASRL